MSSDCPYVEALHVGMTGQHVAAYQRMLHRFDPNLRPQWASPSEEQAFFGEPMKKQLQTFQGTWSQKHPNQKAIPPTGQLGPASHNALSQWADERSKFLLKQEYDRQHAQVTGRLVAVQAAQLALSHRGKMMYSGPGSNYIPKRWQGIQERLMPPNCPTYADCSSLASWCLWVARDQGAHDPSQNNWGWGTTLTMDPHGRQATAATAKPGSLFFYNRPTTHVAIMVERVQGVPMLVSFGGQGGPSYVRYDYRGDLSVIREYFDD